MSVEGDLLQQQAREATGRARDHNRRHLGKDVVTVIPGKAAFELQSTRGLPIEVQIDVAAEHGCVINLNEYWRLMEEHRRRSRAGSKLQGLRTAAGGAAT